MRVTSRTEKWTHFGYAPKQEESPPYLAKVRYFRAPAGLIMELEGINISAQVREVKFAGIIQIHQAHKPASKWGIYPHIEDQDVIFRYEASTSDKSVSTNQTFDLFNYELKEFTVMYRSTDSTMEYRPAIIIYYRYIKFIDTLDKLEYAVKQPRIKKSKGLGQLELEER
ncbi:unnamed protein product [marine sediment metagenome]|uniref:Uncharacterized protein n=1 Tax=marine sediment metagenome TaxID=412755 RepID=X1GT99_9ZZZZ